MPGGLFRRGWRNTSHDAELDPGTTPVAPVDSLAPALAGRSPDAEDGFRMTVAESFTITARGTVLTGAVDAGSVRVGDFVAISGPSSVTTGHVAGIERSGARVPVATRGDQIGLLLAGPPRAPVASGSIVTCGTPARH